MGTGHVMRCLALAQAWQDLGGTASLLSHQLPPALVDRIGQENIQHLPLAHLEHDPAQTCAAADSAEWVAMDGYHFTQEHVDQVAGRTGRLLVLDDLGQFTHGRMALILNQNVTADLLPYRQEQGVPGLLLGGRMALLRREFRSPPPVRDFSEPCQRLLITLGGSDPQQVTDKVIQALLPLPDIHARIIVGAVNPRLEALRALCAGTSGRMEVLSGVKDMVPLMDWAQLAVSAGGTSVLELASRALPTLLIIAADNQEAICERLDEKRIMFNAGWHHQISSDRLTSLIKALAHDGSRRATMAEHGRQMADGHGAIRVAREMLARSAARQISLRPAAEKDARCVFEWANNPVTRSVSFNSQAIEWENHLPWFLSRLHSTSCRIFIAHDSCGQAVGMVRFDFKEGREAVISINMAPESRQRGLGSAVILVACRQIVTSGVAARVTALIKPDNSPSVRAFRRSGFRETSLVEVAGQDALCMVWD